MYLQKERTGCWDRILGRNRKYTHNFSRKYWRVETTLET